MKKALFAVLIVLSLIIKNDYVYAYGNGDITVYITPTGKCYHTSDCWHFRTTKIEISLEEAYINGYQICNDCNPPKYTGTATREKELEKSTNGNNVENASLRNIEPNVTTYDSEKADNRIDASHADGNGDITVYITPTGKCYHTTDCWHFRTTKIEISLEEAYINGYQICNDCNPPKYTGTATREKELEKSTNGNSVENAGLRSIESNVTTYDSKKADNKIDTSLLAIIILCIIFTAYIVYIAFVNVIDRKRKEEEQEKFAQQERQKRERERTEFIQFINGRNIREIAQVPSNIRFVNNLPIDNNNSSFGSFTVYLSKNGNCFHQRQGCCSARYSAHFIKIRNNYSPCSKCCTKNYIIPEWYITYTNLKERAHYLEVWVED